MPSAVQTFRPFGVNPRVEADKARGSSSARGYGRRWQRLRQAFLAQHPICMCDDAKCERPATEVHHKTPHRGDYALMWDWENLQSLTKECHSRITATEGPRPIG